MSHDYREMYAQIVEFEVYIYIYIIIYGDYWIIVLQKWFGNKLEKNLIAKLRDLD